MSKEIDIRKWINEKRLFKNLPYTTCPKKAELIKRREKFILDQRHKQHCDNLYL